MAKAMATYLIALVYDAYDSMEERILTLESMMTAEEAKEAWTEGREDPYKSCWDELAVRYDEIDWEEVALLIRGAVNGS